MHSQGHIYRGIDSLLAQLRGACRTGRRRTVFLVCMADLYRSGYSSLVRAGRYRHLVASWGLESEVGLLVFVRIEHSRKIISVIKVRPPGRMLALVIVSDTCFLSTNPCTRISWDKLMGLNERNRMDSADLACRIIGCSMIAPRKIKNLAFLIELTGDMHNEIIQEENCKEHDSFSRPFLSNWHSINMGFENMKIGRQ